MGRFIAGLALVGVISLALPYPAAAAVGYVSFSPASAVSGHSVEVDVDPTNCSAVDAGPATLRMVLTGPNDGNGAGSDHEIMLKRVGGQHDPTYTFVVPKLDAGGYDVSIACFPDGGLLGMVSIDGGDVFRVLPSTSASASPASPNAPAASTNVVSTIVAVAVALQSLLSGLH